MDLDAKRRELDELRARADALEGELAAAEPAPKWPSGFYFSYYATTGFMLGMFGAMTSLLFNVVGAALVGKHPLELIRSYLTFPLGDQALSVDTGLGLAVGCCLYLATGMLLGVPFFVVLARSTQGANVQYRLLVATVLAIAVWMINFYGILSWLQPLLIDMAPENLIVNRVPPWVAALTHLVFGWTLALLYPLGAFPKRAQLEQS